MAAPTLCHRPVSRSCCPSIEQGKLKQACVNINNSREDPLYRAFFLSPAELTLLSSSFLSLQSICTHFNFITHLPHHTPGTCTTLVQRGSYSTMPPSLMPSASMWLPCLVLLVLWARPTAAFGAGNIASLSSVEGHNWRHGDIEDVLLTLVISAKTGKKFSKMDVKRVYFGNWLRDYSQAVDVGTVKAVSAEAIRILLWVLGFMSFGYGTKEFEVTRDRLGCYRPEEHIDNPKVSISF